MLVFMLMVIDWEYQFIVFQNYVGCQDIVDDVCKVVNDFVDRDGFVFEFVRWCFCYDRIVGGFDCNYVVKC